MRDYGRDLDVGQEVDIYTYPKEASKPFRSLTQFRGTFRGETSTGLLAFDYKLSANKEIRPGASGGIVVDSSTQRIVGVVEGIAHTKETTVLAVPVDALAEFVNRVEPFLAERLFPSPMAISPVAGDIYPRLEPTNTTDIRLSSRPAETAAVKLLRSKAQRLADNMQNFIAVQTFAWGKGEREPSAVAAYEVRVIDGNERLREYPNGKRELQDSPLPPLWRALSTGNEWAALPEMVGTKLKLRIHQAADAFVNKQQLVKVFQYRAEAEDGACQFLEIRDYLYFVTNSLYTVSCYGEVWTDKEMNILRMSEHLDLPGMWKNSRTVVTYGWLTRPDEAPQLVPLTIATQADYKRSTYWCRGKFTDYKKYTSQVKMAAN